MQARDPSGAIAKSARGAPTCQRGRHDRRIGSYSSTSPSGSVGSQAAPAAPRASQLIGTAQTVRPFGSWTTSKSPSRGKSTTRLSTPSALAILILPRWRGTNGMTWYGGFQAPIAGPRRTHSQPPYSASATRRPEASTDADAATRKGTRASGSIRKERARSGKSFAGSGSAGTGGAASVGETFHNSAAVSKRETVASPGGTLRADLMSAGIDRTSGRM